ncbi:MAG: hypothetical protein J0M35_10160 [Candidatus Obscuribacter phosphatis]|uniref:Uncharacterized protein n=1 Tax=Candidatus Obscuribacter phosphatis TaxID=1906157 RepID=A0A8J7PG25_9BACT|nr:hypothetical protein [Candidatus Obscuribacter phosphatis]
MSFSKIKLLAGFSAFALFFSLNEPAQAGRFRTSGAKGALSGYAQQGQYGARAGMSGVAYGQGAAAARAARFQGPNGGAAARAGFSAAGAQGLLHASGSGGNTANGGSWQRGGGTLIKKGEGGAHQSAFSGTTGGGGSLSRQGEWQYKNGEGGTAQRGFQVSGAGGGSAVGYKTNQYDAQTGTGTSTRGRDYNTASGESYGYDASTSYTKGQGFTTTVDTQNKSDYTVQYQKGSKPVVQTTGAPPATSPAP